MFEIYAQDYRITIQEIPLGNQGEDMARCLVIDITDAVNEFGSGGTVSVRNKRSGDELPYFCTNVSTVTGADAEGNVHTYIKWTLTDVDTAAAGSGFVQADYIISGVTVKTWVYKYFILPSLGITGDVPDPYEDILEEIEAQVAAVQAAAASAAASAAQASAEATRIISTTQEVVEDWLSDHIVTGYTVDDTLTISGAAADSATVGTQLRAAFVTEQASGSIASFTDGADNVPVADLVVNITPKQASGTPSPDNVLPITGFTEANITRTGKNLYNVRNFTSLRGITGTVANQVITLNGTATAAVNQRLINLDGDASYLYLKPGKYKLLGGAINSDSYFYVRINTNTIWYESGNEFEIAEGGYGWIVYYCKENTTLNNAEVRLMVVPSDFSDTTYEPYNSEVYNISFGSAGTVYGGTLDVTSGMLTVTHALFNVADIDAVAWRKSGSALNGFYTDFAGRSPINARFVCSHFKFASSVTEYFNNYGYCWRDSSINFNCDPSICGSTITSWHAWLDAQTANGTPVTICYPMNTPVSVQLDATTIKSLLGNNNIWSDTGSVASLEYRADTKLYLEKLTNPDNDMTADSNIASGQYFMVNNTLYLATAAIASGATIVPGTNCTETSLAAALNAINA